MEYRGFRPTPFRARPATERANRPLCLCPGCRHPATVAPSGIRDSRPGAGSPWAARCGFLGGAPDRALMCGPAPAMPRRHLLFPSWRSRVRPTGSSSCLYDLAGVGLTRRAGPWALRLTCHVAGPVPALDRGPSRRSAWGGWPPMPLRGWLGGRAPSRLLPRWCGLSGGIPWAPWG